MNTDCTQIITHVSGASFYKENIRMLEYIGFPIYADVIPDPANIYDSNAHKVYLNNYQVGWLPKALAAQVSGKILQVRFLHFNYYDNAPVGITLSLIYETPLKQANDYLTRLVSASRRIVMRLE